MKTNTLINELIRGCWFLNIHNLDAYAPLVQNILSGNVAVPDGKEIPVLKMYNDNGDSYGATDLEGEEAQKIAVVSMIGPVMKYGDWCTYGADDIVGALDKANNDKSVKAIILYIDGPGGSVSAIGPFIDFAARKQKPVVVLADSAYSLHYWTACVVGDHIMADNNVNSGFGSVGVLLSFMDAKGYYEEKGYKIHEIYGEKSEEFKNKSFRLALEGKYEQMKTEMLNPLEVKFQEGVKAARGSKLKTDVEGILFGKTFYAEQAREYGMIDSIGNFKKAVEVANMLAELRT